MRESQELAMSMSQARRILFVCLGNVCRSPFAAARLKQKRPDLVVESAGYYPEKGRSTPTNAVAAARKLGVDLAGHRSRVLDSAQVDAADLILVFDEQNYGIVCHNHLMDADKVFPLGLADPAGDPFIPDPGMDAPVDGYERCYQRIDELIDRLVG